MDNNSSTLNRFEKKINSLSMNKENLKHLCEVLQERADSAAELEINNYKKTDNIDNEQFEKNKELIKKFFKFSIQITGKNDIMVSGTIDEVFNSVNFPEEVKYLFINTEIKFNVEKYYPRNQFNLFLDFTKPEVFDLRFMPSHETPNESKFEVKGYDATWVNGVFNEIDNIFKEKKSKGTIFHKNNIYDTLLFFVGFPFCFWVSYKSSKYIDTFSTNSFIVNALYLYVFVISLTFFRLIFHYIRWVSPLVEYKSETNNMIKHRVIAYGLFISIFSSFVYDLLKYLVN